MSKLIPGTRWISETEPELGLGLLLEAKDKKVKILFPASETERTYGQANAPLRRVIFKEGDELSTLEGWDFTVTESREEAGLVYYQVGAEWIPESVISSNMTFSEPQEKLLSGNFDTLEQYRLRFESLKHQKNLLLSPARGLTGPRIDLLPHQFYVANTVMGRPYPRVLLADEVGLGKTIEAGLIIHGLLNTGRLERVLVLTPRTLIHQWFVEMLRRFNLKFSVMDTDETIDKRTNPFLEKNLIISSIQLIKGNEKARDFVQEAKYDLIVVDEAHLLKWSKEEVSPEYEIVQKLAKQTPGLLLLTATPEQLGVEGHFARLHLIDPQKYDTLNNYLEKQKNYKEVAEVVSRIDKTGKLESADKTYFEKLGIKVNEDNLDQTLLSLIDTHGTGRVYYRNTRTNIEKYDKFFTSRIPCPHPLANSLDPKDPDIAALSYTFHKDWLIYFLDANKDEKVLLICRSKEKVLALEETLRTETRVKTAIFHSGLNLMNRDRQAAYFTDPEGAQILLCTEMGSEGRNFQFAHHLILFDLPLDPNLLEQRIGRLDRIGQKKDVSIHVPYLEGTSEEVLFKWYHEGFSAFSTSPKGTTKLAEEVHDDLHQALVNPREALEGPGMRNLLDKTMSLHQAILKDLDDGRDRLIERHSFRPETAKALIKNLKEFEQNSTLPDYLDFVFHVLGVDCEDLDGNSDYIKPSDNMFVPYFPELSSDGLSLTYDRAKALEREDLHFMTWDHPMVTGVLEMILGSEIGNATVCTWKDTPAQSPVLCEFLFVFEAVGPKNLGFERFAPPTGIRLLLDPTGKPFGPKFPLSSFDQLLEPAGPEVVQSLARIPREMLLKWVEAAKNLAAQKGEAIKIKSLKAAGEKLKVEIHRLEQLKKQSEAISQDEIDQLRNHAEEILAVIDGGKIRLDALRLILPSS